VPICISSLIFAMLHIGQGAAPIPLFVLALGLGYLYWRTGQLLPCIIVHMLLNGTSMALLWLSIYSPA
ncbi:MAG: CPBP family intramembrane metalloprotease, partial [Planctomycetes bacterium]|nr:CPBP family intramembrane metalloprotease [Planctomycetota bacterium]